MNGVFRTERLELVQDLDDHQALEIGRVDLGAMADRQRQHPHDPSDVVPVSRSRFGRPAQFGYAAYLALVERVVDGHAKRLPVFQIGRRLIGAGAYPLIHRPVHQVELSPDILEV
jgi:hypothetical protein